MSQHHLCRAHVLTARRRGHSFLSTNEELLNSYAACATSEEVIAVQTAYLEAMQADHDRTAARKGAASLHLEQPHAGLRSVCGVEKMMCGLKSMLKLSIERMGDACMLLLHDSMAEVISQHGMPGADELIVPIPCTLVDGGLGA